MRLHPDVQLFPGVRYDLHIRTSKQVKSFPAMRDLLGGGDAAPSLLLGDKLLWTFMQLLVHSCDWHETGDKPFLLYPFSASQFLLQPLHAMVVEPWRTRRAKEPGAIYVICELMAIGFYFMDFGLQPVMDFIGSFTTWITPDPGCMLSEHPFTCGSLALVQLAQQLHLLNWATTAEILELHDWLLSQQPPSSRLYAGGPGDHQQQLATLLTQKGVPAQSSLDRAKMVIGKLGNRQVQSILKNPWAELKALASKPGTMFRLVTQEEQRRYINERAKTRHGAKIANVKAKKQSKTNAPGVPVHLDPDQFELNANHFKDEYDLPVPQIHFDDVASEARGIALCNIEMAFTFLDKPGSISTDALAHLLLDAPAAELATKARLQKIIIPANFKGTDEHTLIYGHVLQLGDSVVSRENASADSNPEVIDTQVIKFQVYRDQLNADWNRFAEAPIRALVSMIDALCMIFELWARSFFDANGHKATHDSATHFTVFMRIPEGALSKLLTSTPHGIYVERGLKPGKHDQRYKVIWLPGSSADEAMHMCRTYDKAMCRASCVSRTSTAFASKRTMNKQHGVTCDQALTSVTFRSSSFASYFPSRTGHNAKPSASCCRIGIGKHPGKGNFHHMAWRVGAQSPPPSTVMTGFQNYAVVTQIKEIKHTAPEPQLIASHKTHGHLRAAPAISTNSKPVASSKPPLAPPGDGNHQLNELQDQLSKNIHDKVAKDLENQAKAAVQAAASS
eukprot:s2451_g5.t1